MFNFLKEKITKVYTHVTQRLASLFSRETLDDSFIQELRSILLSSDAGVETTNAVIADLETQFKQSQLTNTEDAKDYLERQLISRLTFAQVSDKPQILLLVGVNGTGKTTFAAKYAHLLKQQGRKVVLVAADTFRAAAVAQLRSWADAIGVRLFAGREGQDPASVVFDACDYFKKEGIDHLIIDTAGRLQTKVNLMRELEKIKRIIERQLEGYECNTWLTIDSMIGQNSLQQAKLFYEATRVNGLVLTKFDGTGKGGAIFSVTTALSIPVVYITFGEKIEDIKPFNATEYVKNLFND